MLPSAPIGDAINEAEGAPSFWITRIIICPCNHFEGYKLTYLGFFRPRRLPVYIIRSRLYAVKSFYFLYLYGK